MKNPNYRVLIDESLLMDCYSQLNREVFCEFPDGLSAKSIINIILHSFANGCTTTQSAIELGYGQPYSVV